MVSTDWLVTLGMFNYSLPKIAIFEEEFIGGVMFLTQVLHSRYSRGDGGGLGLDAGLPFDCGATT